jgi:dihydrofolate reductase
VRKVIVLEYVSLDGVIQGPGHAGEDPEGGFEAGGWTRPLMAEHARYNNELYQTAGAFLFGRLTYEIWATYWPTVRDDESEVARAINDLPKYVVSTTLNKLDWKPSTLIKGDVAEEVAKLKQGAGKPIFVPGSAALAQTLMQHQLVDEYQLWVHPIVVGRGKRLFREDGPTTPMKLVDSKTTRGGMVLLTYQPQ